MPDTVIRDSSGWEPACAERHMGAWLYEPARFRNISARVLAGTHPEVARPKTVVDGADGPVLYRVSEDGLGMIRILGTMMKPDPKFGGTSTIRTRRALRAAVADKSVRAIMVVIDSGGGTAAGTDSLADEIAATDAVKPTVAYIEDIGASAAYWVASRARRVYANRIALVGSIGTVIVVDDTSGMYEAAGIRTHVITSDGAETYKGAGVEGTEVTPEQIAEWKRLANGVQARFNADIAAGRRMPIARVRELATGQVWMSDEAAELGLIDGVETFDRAAALTLAMVGEDGAAAGRRMTARARLAGSRYRT